MSNDRKKLINVFVSQIFRNEKYIFILMLNIILMLFLRTMTAKMWLMFSLKCSETKYMKLSISDSMSEEDKRSQFTFTLKNSGTI